MTNELAKIRELKDGESFRIDVDKEKAVEKWDFQDSVDRVKPNIWKWGMLSIENMAQVWLAHEALALHGGDRKSEKFNAPNDALNFDGYCTAIGIHRNTGLRWYKRCRYDKKTKTLTIVKDEKMAHVSNNSGDNEWYTPTEYIEAARLVMEDIDLDPASSSEANQIIHAKKFYSTSDDGLSKRWSGRVWMNPPYAQPACSQFSDKLIASIVAGTVTEAIALVNNAMETIWLQTMQEKAQALCFPKGRMKFWEPGGADSHPLQGQVVLYFGPNIKRFIKEFNRFGQCWIAP